MQMGEDAMRFFWLSVGHRAWAVHDEERGRGVDGGASSFLCASRLNESSPPARARPLLASLAKAAILAPITTLHALPAPV